MWMWMWAWMRMRGAMWTCTNRDIQRDIHRNRKTDKRKKTKTENTDRQRQTERQKDRKTNSPLQIFAFRCVTNDRINEHILSTTKLPHKNAS